MRRIYCFTFGSSHLTNYKVKNGTDTFVLISANDEGSARHKMFQEVDDKFCTSYPLAKLPELIQYSAEPMVLSLYDLQMLKKD